MSGGSGSRDSPSDHSNNNSTNTTSSNGNSNKVRGSVRPNKFSPATCTWCGENKTPLLYVFPTQNGKKEFCSETCIAEFRKAYSKGACIECDNVIRGSAPSKEFCSTFCMNKSQKKKNNIAPRHNNNNNVSSNNNITTTSSTTSSTSTTISSGPVTNTTSITGGGGTTIQYESFHVFNWDNYLKVCYVSLFTVVNVFYSCLISVTSVKN